MSVFTIASIYIGSYNISMKIQELSGKKTIRTVDHLRHHLELGTDTYQSGSIGYQKVDELCEVLLDFKKIMEAYRIDASLICAGAAIRDAKNMIFVLDQVKIRTGLQIQLLSNSEQRFLTYESIAGIAEFETLIQEGAAIVDVGGRSVQFTLFDKGKMELSQQIPMGSLRILYNLSLEPQLSRNEVLRIHEIVDKEMDALNILFIRKKKIRHVILVGNFLTDVCRKYVQNTPRLTAAQMSPSEMMNAGDFQTLLTNVSRMPKDELADTFENLNVNNPLFIPLVILYARVTQNLGAEYVWLPGVNINDGITCNYGLKNRLLKLNHDFDADILHAAKRIAKRYECHKEHLEAMNVTALAIFDAMRKAGGMDKRDRILLQTAVWLHDCGKYVCLSEHSDMSYRIIMSSEIIGLSHVEREIVACAVKYHEMPLDTYEDIEEDLTREQYIRVAKFASILRLANAMDRSHKQKMTEFKAVLKERQLIMTVSAEDNFVWESKKFQQQSKQFEEIFSIKPVLKERKAR